MFTKCHAERARGGNFWFLQKKAFQIFISIAMFNFNLLCTKFFQLFNFLKSFEVFTPFNPMSNSKYRQFFLYHDDCRVKITLNGHLREKKSQQIPHRSKKCKMTHKLRRRWRSKLWAIVKLFFVYGFRCFYDTLEIIFRSLC
jgi:hypothetical protein